MILEVRWAALEYEEKTGCAANTLYVGRQEWMELCLEASEHFGFRINAAHEDSGRLECQGLLVFVVNADSHLCVC